jgi:hypothetical protein
VTLDRGSRSSYERNREAASDRGLFALRREFFLIKPLLHPQRKL